VRIELHYFNGTETALDARASVEFVPEATNNAQLKPVRTLFTGPFTLSVPFGKSVTRSVHALDATRHYFALTTHTHALGVRATLERADSDTDSTLQLLHESRDWAEPPITMFDPPLRFAGDGVLLTCEYENPSPATVSFGTSARAEMCFFWAYYY
jgi:hypothetical protein